MAVDEVPKGSDFSDFLDLESFDMLSEMELQAQTSKVARDSISTLHSAVKLHITSAASGDDNDDPDVKPDYYSDDKKKTFSTVEVISTTKSLFDSSSCL